MQYQITYYNNCSCQIRVKCSPPSLEGMLPNANSCLTQAPKPCSELNDCERYPTSKSLEKNARIFFGIRDRPILYLPVLARLNPRKNSNRCRLLYTDTDYK